MDENQELREEAEQEAEEETAFMLGDGFISSIELYQLYSSKDPKDKEELKSIIIKAASNDDYVLVITLLNKGYQLDILNDKKQTLTHLAYLSDTHSTIFWSRGLVFSNCENYKNFIDCNGLSHLHIACAIGQIDAVRKYLDNGEDIHGCLTADCHRDRSGFTPLHFAVAHHQIEVVTLLLERGAEINAADSLGCTPMHLICEVSWDFKKFMSSQDLGRRSTWTNELEILKLLIERKADLNSRNINGNTPLFSIFKNDYYYCPLNEDELVIKDLVAKDKLASFLRFRQLEKFQILFDFGADITIKNYSDENIVHCIIEDLTSTRFSLLPLNKLTHDAAYAKILQSLLQANKELDVNAKNKKDETPIAMTVSLMSYDIALILFGHGVDLKSIKIDGLTFFRYPRVMLTADLVVNLKFLIKILLDNGFELTLENNLTIMKFLAHDFVDCDCGSTNYNQALIIFLSQLLYHGSSAHMNKEVMKIYNRSDEKLKLYLMKSIRLFVEFCKLVPYKLFIDEQILKIVYENTNSEDLESIIQHFKGDISLMKSKKLKNDFSLYDFVNKCPRKDEIFTFLDDETTRMEGFKDSMALLLIHGHSTKSIVRMYIESSAFKSYISLLLPSLPDVCRRIILKYLNNKDILRLCEAALLE